MTGKRPTHSLDGSPGPCVSLKPWPEEILWDRMVVVDGGDNGIKKITGDKWGHADGKFLAYDAQTGAILWSYFGAGLTRS